jgi:hypothetical protein
MIATKIEIVVSGCVAIVPAPEGDVGFIAPSASPNAAIYLHVHDAAKNVVSVPVDRELAETLLRLCTETPVAYVGNSYVPYEREMDERPGYGWKGPGHFGRHWL